MVSDFKKFNEEMSIMETTFITELKASSVIDFNNYDENIIDMPHINFAKVYWSFEINESDEGITDIIPIIKKIEFETNHYYWVQPKTEEYETFSKVEEFTIYQKDIKYTRFDEAKISLPFKPQSIEFDMKTKKVEIDFFNYS
jgi:hypothetical protein